MQSQEEQRKKNFPIATCFNIKQSNWNTCTVCMYLYMFVYANMRVDI